MWSVLVRLGDLRSIDLDNYNRKEGYNYDLRTKEEARKQRQNELRKHLEGYDSSLHAAEKEESFLQRELPMLSDITSIKDRYIESLDHVPSRERVAKGAAGYVAFVGVTGVNL